MTIYESEIEMLLYRMGVNKRYCGFANTVRCVEELLCNKEARECIKIAYTSVRREFRTDNINIERNIRTMLCAIWDNGNRRLLIEFAGRPLEERPSPKEFLNIMTEYVLREYVGADVVELETR